MGLRSVTVPRRRVHVVGGRVKCLTLLLEQDLGPAAASRPRIESPLRSTRLSLHGHLLDSGILNQAIDVVTDGGGSCRVEQLDAAERRDQTSTATLRVTAPNAERLDVLVGQMLALGWKSVEPLTDAQLQEVTQPGVAPANFYSTTIYPTEVRVASEWIRVASQRMDAVVVVQPASPAAKPPRATAECRLLRDLQPGDLVVSGVAGVRVHAPSRRNLANEEFSFMSSGVSTERRVELSADALAWEMRPHPGSFRQNRRRGGARGRPYGR